MKLKLKLNIQFDLYAHPDEGTNDGDIIYVNKYSTKEMALLIIFHEYGHIIYNKKIKRKNIYSNSTMFLESIAWYEGILKLREVEYKFNDVNLDLDCYHGKCNEYIRSCLKSYQNSEYNELNSV